MKKILLVDDSFMSRMLFKQYLQGRKDVELCEAASANLALDMAKNSHYDLYVLDYGLPSSNGVELARQLRAAGVTAPLVLLTAYEAESLANEIGDLNLAAVLHKPITASTVQTVLAQL